MRRIAERPAFVLVIGLATVLAAALAPAGLGGRPVPAVSWVIWAVAFAIGVSGFRAADWVIPAILRRIAWLVPFVLLLAVPAGLLAPPGQRGSIVFALGVRALAAVTVGAALAALVGAAGLVAGVRQLGVPTHLCDILAATLASLTVVTRQLKGMLRAREARRPGFGAWASVSARPVETVRGFGRLVATLLLRSLERAEALEQARRARGAER